MLDLLMLVPLMLSAVEVSDKGLGLLGGMLGTGLIVMGSSRGIGQVAGCAVEAIARQPEAGNRIFTTMIIAAALIEGITLFAMIICLLVVMK
jgi:F-type H+-transporting ATPase subunit c